MGAGERDRASTAGDVTFEGATAVPVLPAVGNDRRRRAALARRSKLRSLRARATPVVVADASRCEPVLTDADVQHVADQATAVLSAPYEIVHGRHARRRSRRSKSRPHSTTTRAADGTGLALVVDPARLGTAVGDGGRRVHDVPPSTPASS